MNALFTAPRLLAGCFFTLAFILGLACRPPEVSQHAKAREVWKQHQSVVEAAARGENVDLDSFKEAALFFERLTGIIVPGEHSTLIDYAPTDETGTALGSLRSWYADNEARLLWDDARQEVILRSR